MPFDIPNACTLPTAERPIRLAEFDTLLNSSLVAAARDTATHLTLRLRGDARLEAATRDLAEREASCCSFFDFTIEMVGDEVVLGIGVPTQHASILDSVQSKAAVAR